MKFIQRIKLAYRILFNKVEKGDIVSVKESNSFDVNNYNENLYFVKEVFNNKDTLNLLPLKKDVYSERNQFKFKSQIINIVPKNTLYFKDDKYYYI